MKKRFPLLVSVLLFLIGCTSQAAEPLPTTNVTQTSLVPTESSAAALTADCPEAAYTAPSLPAEIPGYLNVDPATGLHMTGNVQQIEPESYRLLISGLVDHPLALRVEELRCMPKISADPLLVCEGFFTDEATWAGVPLAHVLDLAGIQPEASEIILVSEDGYQVSLNLNEALGERNFLAYELNGDVLPILHGFPLRAVFPGRNGNMWVKWLVEIQVK